MVDQPTPEAIQKYRDMLLTNPATYRQKLEQGREAYRSRVEGLFIDRELTEEDEAMTDEDARKQELERIDGLILQTGGRVEDIDAKIVEHDKKHPPGSPQLSRKQRRELERRGVNLRQVDPMQPRPIHVHPSEEPALTEPAEPPEAE